MTHTSSSMKGSTSPGFEAELNTLLNHTGKSDCSVSWITSNIRFFPLKQEENICDDQSKCNRFMRKLWGPEGAAVKGRGDGDNGVDGRKRGQEEDDQQHGHVEVVGAGGLEDSFLRHIAAHDSPTLQVHGHVEPQHIQGRQAGGVEGPHPVRRQRLHGRRHLHASSWPLQTTIETCLRFRTKLMQRY